MTAGDQAPGGADRKNGSVDAGAVGALARELEELRRQVRPMAGLAGRMTALAGRVDELATTVTDAVEQVSAVARRSDPVRPVSWIADPERDPTGEAGDPHLVARRLTELAEWVAQVYLHYPISARDLPSCWLWHPDIVEELAWLMQAWRAAYDPDTGRVAAVADWHDRWRPGVTTRIKAAARSCSLHEHLGPDRPGGMPVPPPAGSADAIATWWSTARDRQPPVPSEADTAQAARRLKERRR